MKKQESPIHILVPDTAKIERQVIADAVCTENMLDEVIPLIHEDFFTSDERRKMWKDIVKLYGKGESVNTWIIGSIHGDPFVQEIIPLMAEAGGTITCVQHAAILRSEATKRRAFLAAESLMSEALKPENGEADILSKMSEINAQVEGPAPLQSEVKLVNALVEVKADFKNEEQLKEQGETTRIRTGFRFLDDTINKGFKAGQLIILAARPSVGKTSVMLQMAKTAAKDGNPVQIISLEMTCSELCEKLLYSTGKVHPYQVAQSDIEWQAYEEAEGQLSPLPLYINDFSRRLDDIVSRLTMAVKHDRCKIAFIDYLGLIQDALNFGNAKLYQVIAKITGTLKAVAKRLHIPIVLLCQLNREQAREKRSPELFDLRDSGSIEQDADIVIMLEPKQVEDKQAIYAWLRKNRSGKRDMAFVLMPNSTYSEFTEQPPISAIEKPSPLEAMTSEASTDTTEDPELDIDYEQDKTFDFYK